MTRTEARAHVFLLLFQMPFNDFTPHSLVEAKNWHYSNLDDQDRPKGKLNKYIDRVLLGVLDNQGQIDGVIEQFLKGWEIGRISKVDLAAMRLAVYEMLREPDVPLGVAVSEAVELAKAFGTEDSPGFVSGVLNNISRNIKARDISG